MIIRYLLFLLLVASSVLAQNQRVTSLTATTGGITNTSWTASTALSSDANKRAVSISNGTGAFTNNGSGTFGWFSGYLTTATDRQVGSSALTNVAAGANVTNLSHSPLASGQLAITNGTTGLDRGMKSLQAGTEITLTDQGTNILVGLTTSINTRQLGSANLTNWSALTTNTFLIKQAGSDVLTNLATTKAVTNITVTTITNTGASLYTVPSGCRWINVKCIGGGGGGGGVDGATSQSAAGGGGGSGAYCETNIASPAASYIVIVGTNGLGGAAGNNNGNIGGTTSFTNILTATGGLGGSGDASAAAVGFAIGGAGAAETATGSIYSGGSPGQNGICISAALAVSGGGAGAGVYGGGGAPQTAAVGGNATGKGAGGGGAAVITNTDRAGGNGSPGVIIITEFY